MVVYNYLAWLQENKSTYYTKTSLYRATIFIVHTHTHKHTPTHKQGQLNMREMFWILACWNLLYNL